MSFKLLKPLFLEEASTSSLSMIPTVKYFKPVIVISAPFGPEPAALLEADWAFDKFGNPHSFDGSLKLTIEVAGGIVQFSTGQGDYEIQCEKVASFSVYREQKTGMRCKLSCHMPDFPEREDLHKLLDYLASINKEKFSLRVESPQGSLLTEELAIDKEIPFQFAVGRKVGLVGSLQIAKLEDGYVFGWECKAPGFKQIAGGGKALDKDSIRFPDAQGAINQAASECLRFAKEGLNAESKAEIEAAGKLVDQLVAAAPILHKGEAQSQTQ